MSFEEWLKSYFGNTEVEMRPDGWNELLDAVRIAKAVHNYTLLMAAGICREKYGWEENECGWLCAQAIEARIKE